ncbi:MAG: hypothetical protein MAG451_00116 [Anaerolineales bacterium]|nr:hypothetical protein [Anaerolineales bacterium]
MKCLGRLLQLAVVALLIIVAIVVILPRVAPVTPTAELEAVISAVERLNGETLGAESVATGATRTMYERDGVGVDDAGYARLDMNGCLLGIFRNSEIEIEGLPTDSAPACIIEFEHGTIYNRVKRKTVIDAQWAVITSIATEFLVHLNRERGIIWIVVHDGAVEVEAAGQTVIVEAGWQTWVFRGQPPEEPVPATRPDVGDLFPSIDDLTNGVMVDGDLLEPREEEPAEDLPPEVRISVEPKQPAVGEPVVIVAEATDDVEVERVAILVDGEAVERCSGSACKVETEFGEPGAHTVGAIAQDTSGQSGEATTRIRAVSPAPSVSLEISQSTDEVIAGECSGVKTVQIVAEITGSVADVQQAVLQYRWEDVTGDPVVMERVDDQTFIAEIGPFDYCCAQTTIEYNVQVFGSSTTPLASRSGKVLLTYCIG